MQIGQMLQFKHFIHVTYNITNH